MKRPTIRLLLSNGVFCRYITAREAADLEAKGEAQHLKRISKKKNKSRGMPTAITYKLLPQPEPLRSIMEASPPSITRADMLANVGITNGLGPPDRNRIKRARAKTRMFEPSDLGTTPSNPISDFDRAAVELYSNSQCRPTVMWMSLGVAAEFGCDISTAPKDAIVRLSAEGFAFEVPA